MMQQKIDKCYSAGDSDVIVGFVKKSPGVEVILTESSKGKPDGWEVFGCLEYDKLRHAWGMFPKQFNAGVLLYKSADKSEAEAACRIMNSELLTSGR